MITQRTTITGICHFCTQAFILSVLGLCEMSLHKTTIEDSVNGSQRSFEI